MTNMRIMTFLLLMVGMLISFKDKNAETKEGSSSPPPSPSIPVKLPSTSWVSSPSIFLDPSFSSSSSSSFSHFKSVQKEEDGDDQSVPRALEYDFYRDSCPQADKIIRHVVQKLYGSKNSVAPALIRLVFHDCFIEGCDASVLLDSTKTIESEKDSPPNYGLKGYDVIDSIKSELEGACPGVVSCADVIVLAAREAVVQAGGPFYPLYTGRRDGVSSFRDTATYELPSPYADLSATLASFASIGFDERETVALLGAHSIGKIHCRFFQNRLYDFGGTNKPDPSIDGDFLQKMRSKCAKKHMAPPPSRAPASSEAPLSFSGSPPSHAPASSEAPLSFSGSPLLSSEKPGQKVSPSSSSSMSHSYKHSPLARHSPTLRGSLHSSPDDQGLDMAYEGPGVDFGTLYYRSLLEGKGILYADQQLMAGEQTMVWVKAYAADASLFRRDFALAMMKLSNLGVLTGSAGQVRFNCSKVV